MIPTGLARKFRLGTVDLPLPAMPGGTDPKLLQLSGDRTALEFVDPPESSSGGGTWGSITGTLSNQTDLQTALAAKLNAAGGTMTGAWALNTGYGSGAIRPYADGTNGRSGLLIQNFFGNTAGHIYGDNSGNLIFANSNNTGTMTINALYLSAIRFRALETNGGANSAPLFALDTAVNFEGGFYRQAGGQQVWCSSRTDRVSLARDGTLAFVTSIISMANLPTTNPAVVGRLWNDSGTVKVSAG